MSAFKAIAKGLGTTFRKPRIILILYVFNLAFAVLAAVPFVLLIQRELGASLLGSSVRPVDVMWIGEEALEQFLADIGRHCTRIGVGGRSRQVGLQVRQGQHADDKNDDGQQDFEQGDAFHLSHDGLAF